jgi:hypothetical protein
MTTRSGHFVPSAAGWSTLGNGHPRTIVSPVKKKMFLMVMKKIIGIVDNLLKIYYNTCSNRIMKKAV